MTKAVTIGHDAPGFKLKNQDDIVRTNADFKDNWLVLYFYPKDNTPGCTNEAIAFTELKQKFSSRNAHIVGVSPDSVISHQKFIQKKDLSLELLSDIDKTAAQSFGVWQQKKMAGREYMGVVRTTFLIDPEGKIQHKWENLKVNGHADAVYTQLCECTK